MRGRSLLCVSVGVCLMALFVAGCGEDSTRGASSGSTTSTATVTTSTSTTSTSTTSTTVSTETATTTFFAPDCDHGTQLASVAGGVAFVETTDHRFLCVVGGAGRPLAVSLLSDPPVVMEPQFSGFGSMLSGRGGGAIYLFLLPARPDDPVIVRDEAGRTVIYVLTTSGRQLAVFEPQSEGDTTLPQPFGRTWKIVDPVGTVLATLATPAAPSQSGPIPTATTTSPESVVTSVAATTVPSSVPSGSGYEDHETPQCLFEHGLSAADPQPYSPAVAMPAWQACRDLMVKGMELAGMPADVIARQMAFWDCMAEQGWIWLQPSARDASAKCGRA